jgi:hypothetical protein
MEQGMRTHQHTSDPYLLRTPPVLTERVDTDLMETEVGYGCCNHACNEGRDCPNSQGRLDWSLIAIYAASAATSIFVIGAAVVGIRWIITQL